jgi:hypothetical protein
MAIPATPKAMMKACECHRAKGLKLNAKNVAINGNAITDWRSCAWQVGFVSG